ncbi:MAG TPA: hypothetical protein VKY73_06495 [Polyangiaceae bacterium]|nr:hypothetical protein [Polyangiaceae bacterium]
MIRAFALRSLAKVSVVALLALGCESGGVGDPCIPEDEYQANFSGFAVNEINTESKSFQCETRICLANHFQGRVSCPYGQTEQEAESGQAKCMIPGSDEPITVAVAPQYVSRRADLTVYCSCRCDGPQANARYCECPSGYKCAKLVDDIGVQKEGQLAGSYCIKEGTDFSPGFPRSTCNRERGDCGHERGPFATDEGN